jgi:hypothetical protein
MCPVTLVGADALAAKFTADCAKVNEAKLYWLPEVGNLVKESIQANIMRQGLIRSGDLYDSVRVFNQTKNGVSVGTGWGLGYAEPLELGAAPHEIAAGAGWWSDASMLMFQLDNGDFFVGPKVQHPGNVAYRFVFQGTFEAFTPILMMFNSMLRAIFS